MSRYAPYGVLDDAVALGLHPSDLPTPLGPLRVHATGPVEHAVVFLHGVGQSWVAWTPVLQAARELGIDTSSWVFVDLPGFGASAELPGPITLEQVGEAVLAGLVAQGVRAVHLVGHSMGGFLALDLMARPASEPRITGGIVLGGAYAGIVELVNRPLRLAFSRPALAVAWSGLWFGSLLGSAPARLMAHVRALRRGFAALLGLVAAHPLRLPDSFVRSLLSEVRPRSFRLAARTGVGYDCAATWARIQVPVTAVFGETDRLVDPTDRKVLASACPAVTVVVLEDTGHFAPVERPEEVARLVSSRTSPPAPSA